MTIEFALQAITLPQQQLLNQNMVSIEFADSCIRYRLQEADGKIQHMQSRKITTFHLIEES